MRRYCEKYDQVTGQKPWDVSSRPCVHAHESGQCLSALQRTTLLCVVREGTAFRTLTVGHGRWNEKTLVRRAAQTSFLLA